MTPIEITLVSLVVLQSAWSWYLTYRLDQTRESQRLLATGVLLKTELDSKHNAHMTELLNRLESQVTILLNKIKGSATSGRN